MRWIKFFIAVGVIVMAFFLTLPYWLGQIERQEQRRFTACQQHQRLDCEPSLIWMMENWVY